MDEGLTKRCECGLPPVGYPEPEVLAHLSDSAAANVGELESLQPVVIEAQQSIFPPKTEGEIRKFGIGDVLVSLHDIVVCQLFERVGERLSSLDVILQKAP